jgi:UrcA family protein
MSTTSQARIQLETNMNSNVPVLTAKAYIGIAALAACVVLSGSVQANGHEVTVKISVSAADLDLSQPSDARELYSRLHKAARVVCGDGNRVDLRPPTVFADCYEQAVGDAVRSANRPQLTLVYLRTHTLQDAAARGIDVPVLVAAK